MATAPFTSPQEAFTALEASGSEQNRKIYRRHGTPDPLFGVSYATLKTMAKQVPGGRRKKGRNQPWAEYMWATGVAEARLFATMIAEPEACGQELLERWLHDVNCYMLADAFAQLAAESPTAAELAESWITRAEEYPRRLGFSVSAVLAQRGTLSQERAVWLLDYIEKEQAASPNRAREAMNHCLIAIGGIDDEMRAAALAASARIGPIRIDHGDTGCKDFVPEEYIARIWERKAKAPRPA